MKKIKIIVASVLFGVIGHVGYTAYEKMTMSEAEKFMQVNVEALTQSEEGVSTSWPCRSEEKAGSGGYWRCGNPCEWISGAIGKGTVGQCYK